MDVHTRKVRSYNMSRIKGKNTSPEIQIRKWLWTNGFRYRLHKKNLPGKPDIVFSSKQKVIFINGCFWHKHSCKYFKWPKTNEKFWRDKIEENVRRDKKNINILKKENWEVLILWECEIKKSFDSVISKMELFLSN